MSLFKKIYYRSASLIPIDLLKRISSVNPLLPYHHVVSNERLKHICHLYTYKNLKQFEADLDYLLLNFNPIHPLDIIQAVNNGKILPKNSFLLTFDDGFRESSDIIAPLLIAKGIPALFFLNPAFMDNTELGFRNKLSLIIEKLANYDANSSTIKRVNDILNIPGKGMSYTVSSVLNINYRTKLKADELANCLEISFSDYLYQEKPYLQKDQIGCMIEKGFCFGGHSLDHPNYKYLTLEEQLFQTTNSCKMIHDWFSLDYSAFSFPHDDTFILQHFFDKLSTSDQFKIDILFGTQNQKVELRNRMFHRFNAERPDIPIENLIKGVLFYQLKSRKVIRK